MSKLLKVLDLLMSDIAVACYAAVIAVVVFVTKWTLPVMRRGRTNGVLAWRIISTDSAKLVWSALLRAK